MILWFAIGERAELIQTNGGNILWDLIPFLDQETVDKVRRSERHLDVVLMYRYRSTNLAA